MHGVNNMSTIHGHAGLLAAALAVAMAVSPPLAGDAAAQTSKGSGKWSYQLQGDMGSTTRTNSDLAVVDPDHTGSPQRLKKKPGGGDRPVLAYISIGEAETWRGYKSSGKSWNTGKTQGWNNNYAVKYWDPEWKAIVKNRVRKALDQGYDGVYLDRVDTYENVKAPGGSRAEMIKLVKEVAAEVKSKKRGAKVYVQNAEELLTDKGYVSAIDGIAKEDLYYGINHDGRRNSKGDIAASLSLLKKAQAQGKAVHVVEYVSGSARSQAESEIRKQGFKPAFAPRSLDRAQD
jgi:cysteinyl-tRNA synthetase